MDTLLYSTMKLLADCFLRFGAGREVAVFDYGGRKVRVIVLEEVESFLGEYTVAEYV